MKPGSILGACLLALLGEPILGQEANRSDFPRDEAQYQKGFKAGVEEANQELARGNATIYGYGLKMAVENIDRATGLPTREFGCVVDDELLGRTTGHNDRIHQSIKENGLPANSLQRWDKELFGLKDYFDGQLKGNRSHPLIPGGPAIGGPDGTTTIRPVTIAGRNRDGTPSSTLGIVIHDDGGDQEPSSLLVHGGESDFFWGPRDSGFVVIRSQQDGKSRYLAIALKTGRWLRMEH